MEEPTWEVYDPWTAQIRGRFYLKKDAKLFRKALLKRKREDKYA